MESNICKIYEHVFSVNKNSVLECEKCNRKYMQYMDDIKKYTTEYRKN